MMFYPDTENAGQKFRLKSLLFLSQPILEPEGYAPPAWSETIKVRP